MSTTYKVTAIKDVTFQANVRTQIHERIGGETVWHPREHAEWITLHAGEVRDGLGMVLQVHPKHGLGIHEVWASDNELPKEIAGLYRLEISLISA